MEMCVTEKSGDLVYKMHHLVRIGIVPMKRKSLDEESARKELPELYEESTEPNYEPAKCPRQSCTFVRSSEEFAGNDCGCLMRCFSNFTITQFIDFESRYKHMTLQQQHTIALSHIKVKTNWHMEGAFKIFSKPTFFYEGREVCVDAFQFVYDLSDHSLQKILSLARDGCSSIGHKRVGMKIVDSKTAEAESWIICFLENAEHVPNMNCQVVTSETCVRGIYQRYYRTFRSKGWEQSNLLTEQSFRKVWRSMTTDASGQLKVYVGKQCRQGVVYCGICAVLEAELEKAPARQKPLVQSVLAKHKEQADVARKLYEKMRTDALDWHKGIDAIELDGIDAKKCVVPRVTKSEKISHDAQQLEMNITGAYFHCSDGRYLHYYLDFKEFSKNCNRVISLIVHTLLMKKGHLGTTLYLQLDGAGENKNIWVFSFAALLVSLRVYDKVIFSFLPPGHTHIGIDRGFGRVSVQLNNGGIHVLEEFEKRILTSQDKPVPTIEYLSGEYIHDFKEWLDPTIMKPFKNHKNPHYWEFYQKDGISRMRYKDHYVSNDWHPTEEARSNDPSLAHGYRIFKEEPSIEWLDKPPRNVQPFLEDEYIEKVMEAIPSNFEHLKDWDQSISEAWKSFFEDVWPTKLQEVSQSNADLWGLKQLYFKAMARDNSEIAQSSTGFQSRMETGEGKMDLVKTRIFGTAEPVRIGPQGKAANQPIAMGEIQNLEQGKFVIVQPDMDWGLAELGKCPEIDFTQHPWVGKVYSKPNFEANTVEVLWYQARIQGQLQGVWYPLLKQKKTKNQPEILAVQEIPLTSIEFFNFELRKGDKLPKKMIDSAKEVMKKFNDTLMNRAGCEFENNANNDDEINSVHI